jgi:molecular chaperone Hsp33
MRKKKPYGNDLREQLLASARDRLYHFLLDFGGIRGALLHATRMVNEMRTNHELGAMETLLLGHAYIAAGLMSVNLKGSDRLSLKVQCDGPARGLSVEANAFGEVRGYLVQSPFPPEELPGDGGLQDLLGSGTLSVTRYLEGARHPFTGQVELQHGTLAQDLVRYFLISEQTPSSLHFSVKFDGQGEVSGAGGLFLQVMPAAEERTVARVEELLQELPSIGGTFASGVEAESLLRDHFQPFSPLVLGSRRVAFMCHCGARRFGAFLAALPVEELADIMDTGPFPLVTICHNCNTSYSFSREEIAAMYRRARERAQGPGERRG